MTLLGLLVELNGAPGLEGGVGSDAGGCIAIAGAHSFCLGSTHGSP